MISVLKSPKNQNDQGGRAQAFESSKQDLIVFAEAATAESRSKKNNQAAMNQSSLAEAIGLRAENRVISALAALPPPWQSFHTVEWRTLNPGGEVVGEADVVVFHPHHGLIVFEIKAGAVSIREGVWCYASGLPMKQSPFSQARRNRYALMEKLRQLLGKSAETLTVTHAVWFPEVVWKAPLPGTEAPSKAFLLDRGALANPENALLRIFREAASAPLAWTRNQQQALKALLAPDCNLLVPLAGQLDATVTALHQATEQQITVLRLLRTQPRLLVEGGAGTGKTLLACALAREHAALGKQVLFTCYNRQLAAHLAATLADVPNVIVRNFHDLVKAQAEAAGLPYSVPPDDGARRQFFNEDAADLLLLASEYCDPLFDSLIVDEAADFLPTWWLALESLGRSGFSWYCFYDRRQSIYQAEASWEPPFAGVPMSLDINLRNPRPIGTLAAKWGQCPAPMLFRVEDGPAPRVMISASFAEMAGVLRHLLRDLLEKEELPPERIVVLAPYKHGNPKSTWSAGLSSVDISTDLAHPQAGKVRVGTLQGFKGLEADVVILAGIDAQASKHPEWLYVGASRARGALYVLALVHDTKWKLLDGLKANGTDKYGLSQSDFYQLHAYGQSYLDGTGDVVLIYPKTDSFDCPLPVFNFPKCPDLRLWVLPFCLKTRKLLIPAEATLPAFATIE